VAAFWEDVKICPKAITCSTWEKQVGLIQKGERGRWSWEGGGDIYVEIMAFSIGSRSEPFAIGSKKGL
jgi:hypothetical protein